MKKKINGFTTKVEILLKLQDEWQVQKYSSI